MAKQRYAIVRGQVFRWEEKAPFVESGKSVLGALEYDPELDALRCHECGQWQKCLHSHVWHHHGPVRAYKAAHGLRASTGLHTPRAHAEWTKLNVEKSRKRGPLVGKPFALGHRTNTGKRHATEEGLNERNTCKAQVAARIRAIAKDMGKTPGRNTVPVSIANLAVKRFGGWGKACVAAGLIPNATGTKGYDDAVLIELLRDFYVLNRRLPSHRDWNKGSLPSRATYRDHFGSVDAAYGAAGLSTVNSKVA